MDCLFCKIVQGKIPADIVYSDERILAFRDINAQSPVHILIIPRKHVAGLNDITPGDNELLGEMMNIARELAQKEHIDREGYRLTINCGKAAGQAVAHLHYHLLGGRAFSWPPG